MTGGQYSLLRMLLGVTLAVFWGFEAAALFGGAPVGDAPPWLPDPFALAESGYWSGSLAVLGGVLSLLLAIGAWDRWFAVALAYLFVAHVGVPSFGRVHPGGLGLVVGLLVHVFQRAAPYLSWQARGRVDPGGGWKAACGQLGGRWPVFRWNSGPWCLLWFAYLVLGFESLGEPDVEILETQPQLWLGVLAFVFVAGSLSARWRPRVWLLLLVAQIFRLVWLDPGIDAAGMIVWHAFVFDHRWVKPVGADGPDWVFYDGHCGLCHRFVRFLLAEDVDGRAFRFAPLQGPRFEQTVPAEQRGELPDSLVLPMGDRLLVKSEATHTILRRLGGWWRVIGEGVRLVPRPLRDAVYDGVARVRRRVFGEPEDTCPIIPGHLRARFE